jgi:hypothetical protein
MPGMDGIEATQRIRELGTGYAKNLPIIALTANAVVGNEEMFLSKGFQAFLSKPIDIARLDAVIRQWLRNQEKERLYEGIAPPGPGETHEVTVSLLEGKAVNGLNIIGGVERFNGDEEVYINILHSYTVNTRGLLDSLEGDPEGRLKSYEITVHSIKGSSFGICADNVGRLAADLERAAKTCEMEYIYKHNQVFLDVTRRLISDIEKMLASLDVDSEKEIIDKPDIITLKKLIIACDAYDMDRVDAAMDELTSYQYESDDGLVDWLRENVDMMNFDEIVEKLREVCDGAKD